VVGLGLRNLAHCPVELNLMPESTLKWQSFNQKKPYLIATVFSLVAGIAAMGFLFDRLAGVKNDEMAKIQPQVDEATRKSEQFKRFFGELKKAQTDVERIGSWVQDRYYWADVLGELRQVLIRVEMLMKDKLRTETGVWVERFTTAAARADEPAAAADQGTAAPVPNRTSKEFDDAFRKRYGLAPKTEAAAPAEQAPAPVAVPTAGGPKKPRDTNEISSMTIVFRAISLNNVSGDANMNTAYTVLNELRNSPFFEADPEETKFSGNIGSEESPGTFTFSVVARLKHPLKL
jgi:hypothetical protein